MRDMALEIDQLTVRRGNRVVVDRLSMSIAPGKIVALLGPNGAGKSSLVLALAGVLPSGGGTVRLGGNDLAGLPPEAVRRLGVAAIPEGHQVLSRLSVEDNLRAAGAMLRGADLPDALEQVYRIFPELRERCKQPAGTLSGGQQQMVALGHALVSRPACMLIDEMSLGLAPIVVRRLMGVVEELAASGVGVLLIEQFTHLALAVADEAYVMSRAAIHFRGAPSTLIADPDLLHAAYLGTA